MNKEVCSDNRFDIIEKAKKDIINSTNIESSPDEMKVLDNMLFRCWQMGWLDKYDDNIQPKPQFKPFDKVLVRDNNCSKWECDLFSHLGDEKNVFVCISDWWYQCIPYEGNEDILGTIIKPE